MRSFVAGLIELAGGAAIVYGCWLIKPWLAWIVGGLCVVVAASALERKGAS